MPTVPTRTDTTRDLVRNLLDKGYADEAGQVVNAITRRSSEGIIAQRLQELEAEAVRLKALGETLKPDNAVLRALRADFNLVITQNSQDIDRLANVLQVNGVQAAQRLTRVLTIGDVSDKTLASIGVKWNNVDPEAVSQLVGYANSAAWRAELRRYESANVQNIIDIAVRGIANGWNPLRTAVAVRDAVQSMPLYEANTMMRTLQLQSMRDATTINQQANADILEGAIRIAVLDARTCLCCIAEHGTFLKLGERVLDHHNGRCTSIGKVKGVERTIQSGETWFNNLTEIEKQSVAGPGGYEALKSGKATLKDFVQEYTDPVFGKMVREAPLKTVLG